MPNSELMWSQAAAELRSAWTGEAPVPTRTPKTKNLRVVLPRDDAEDLKWKPGVSMQNRREPRTLCTRLDASTSPRGQAVNPSQAGFHFIKRECPPIPFAPGRKSLIF